MQQPIGVKKGTTINLIRDILKSEMNLADERIFYYNEDYVLPEDHGLWVIVAFNGSKLYANRNSTFIDEKTGNFMERQSVNTQEQITVHLMSFGLEALERQYEVPQALASIYAQNLQSAQAFKIAPIMNVIDASEQEGGRINYRFDWRVTVLSWQDKIKETEYYDGVITKLTVASGTPKNATVEFNPAVKPVGL